MVYDASEAESAEQLSRRRMRALPGLAAIFISQQAIFVVNKVEGERLVERVQIGAWLALSLALLLLLATGGGYIYSKRVRDLANDEVTRANRQLAAAAGFWAAMIAAIALYVLDLIDPISGRDAAHITLTAGIATALLRFGLLERRAHSDG